MTLLITVITTQKHGYISTFPCRQNFNNFLKLYSVVMYTGTSLLLKIPLKWYDKQKGARGKDHKWKAQKRKELNKPIVLAKKSLSVVPLVIFYIVTVYS